MGVNSTQTGGGGLTNPQPQLQQRPVMPAWGGGTINPTGNNPLAQNQAFQGSPSPAASQVMPGGPPMGGAALLQALQGGGSGGVVGPGAFTGLAPPPSGGAPMPAPAMPGAPAPQTPAPLQVANMGASQSRPGAPTDPNVPTMGQAASPQQIPQPAAAGLARALGGGFGRYGGGLGNMSAGRR